MITQNIDRTTEISDEYRKTILPAPPSVKISLDDNCQFRCNFCTSRLQPEKSQMPWEMFTRVIDELHSRGTKEIGLFYIGEPMLAERLVDAVRYCKQVGIEYVFITTNGHLAKRDKVKQLMEAGLDSLKFSFNYVNGEQLKDIAGVSPKVFYKIVENIKDAWEVKKEGNFKCGIYASSIMFDGEQGERMKETVDLILPYVDEHYWLPCFSFGGQTDLGLVQGNPGRLGNMRPPLPCWSGLKEGHVTASGKVSFCCFDSHEKWVLGDLKESSFMSAWNSDKAQRLRAAHLSGDVTGTECEQCALS
jgi:radical SAM protein with 4Fe4S-binding SPASM domain